MAATWPKPSKADGPVGTSAFYAVMDRDDANHPTAREVWTALIRGAETLLTTN